MLGAGIDLQLEELATAEPGAGQHAPYRPAHHLFGPRAHEVAVAGGGEPPRIAAVAIDDLLLRLVGREHHFGGVHHDDVVAGVDVRGEDRLVLAPQARGNLGGQASQHETVGVDDVPGPLDVVSLGRKSAHAGYSSSRYPLPPPRRTAEGWAYGCPGA